MCRQPVLRCVCQEQCDGLTSNPGQLCPRAERVSGERERERERERESERERGREREL